MIIHPAHMIGSERQPVTESAREHFRRFKLDLGLIY